jgi:hypothetical protein
MARRARTDRARGQAAASAGRSWHPLVDQDASDRIGLVAIDQPGVRRRNAVVDPVVEAGLARAAKVGEDDEIDLPLVDVAARPAASDTRTPDRERQEQMMSSGHWRRMVLLQPRAKFSSTTFVFSRASNRPA